MGKAWQRNQLAKQGTAGSPVPARAFKNQLHAFLETLLEEVNEKATGKNGLPKAKAALEAWIISL